MPKEKPVYVFCRNGDWSEEITEVLADRGYEAYNLEGGFKAYEAVLVNAAPISIKGTAPSGKSATAQKDKTFVVFSGDLDKTRP